TAVAEHVDHVLEVLHVAALVGADRDCVGVLLDRRPDDLLDAAVVAEVDDLGAAVLDQPAHHVDRAVVPVEQRAARPEPQRRGDRRSVGSSGCEPGLCDAHRFLSIIWASGRRLSLICCLSPSCSARTSSPVRGESSHAYTIPITDAANWAATPAASTDS